MKSLRTIKLYLTKHYSKQNQARTTAKHCDVDTWEEGAFPNIYIIFAALQRSSYHVRWGATSTWADCLPNRIFLGEFVEIFTLEFVINKLANTTGIKFLAWYLLKVAFWISFAVLNNASLMFDQQTNAQLQRSFSCVFVLFISSNLFFELVVWTFCTHTNLFLIFQALLFNVSNFETKSYTLSHGFRCKTRVMLLFNFYCPSWVSCLARIESGKPGFSIKLCKKKMRRSSCLDDIFEN